MRTWARAVEAGGNDAYLYFFSQAPPVFRIYVPERAAIDMPDGPDGYGAYHSGDLAYAFGNTQLVGIDWTEWDHEISRAMTQYWVNFARTGDPNGEDLATWPRYEAAADEWLEFGSDIKTTREVRKEQARSVRSASTRRPRRRCKRRNAGFTGVRIHQGQRPSATRRCVSRGRQEAAMRATRYIF